MSRVDINSYKTLNSSFKKVAVFQLTQRGFCSEVNNMILGILYCLVNEIQFTLNTDKWNMRISNGWTDYFQSFCPASSKGNYTTDLILLPSDLTGVISLLKTNKRLFLKLFLIFYPRKLLGLPGFTTLYMSDIWKKIRSKEFTGEHFHIPELGIDGDIFHAKQIIASMIFRFNDETKSFVDSKYKVIKEPFIATQIRRGDKLIEADFIPIEAYVNKIEEVRPEGITSVFAASDSTHAIECLKDLCPDSYNIWSFDTAMEDGHFQETFNSLGTEKIKAASRNLLVDIYTLIKSEQLVGTYSSNILRFVVLFKGRESCHSLDEPWCPI